MDTFDQNDNTIPFINLQFDEYLSVPKKIPRCQRFSLPCTENCVLHRCIKSSRGYSIKIISVLIDARCLKRFFKWRVFILFILTWLPWHTYKLKFILLLNFEWARGVAKVAVYLPSGSGKWDNLAKLFHILYFFIKMWNKLFTK